MFACFNEPQRVGLHGILVACHFLLLPTPLGQLDLVREEITTSHHVSESKVCPQSPQPFTRFLITLVPPLDLDDPIVISVPDVAGHTIR
jgi:hypothetical protein